MIRHCFKGYCCKSDISSINGRAVEITPTVPLILYYKNKYILPLKQIWEQQYLQQAGSRAPHQPRYSRIIRQDNINLVLNTLSSKWEKKLRKLKIHTLPPLFPPIIVLFIQKNIYPHLSKIISLFPFCAKQWVLTELVY